MSSSQILYFCLFSFLLGIFCSDVLRSPRGITIGLFFLTLLLLPKTFTVKSVLLGISSFLLGIIFLFFSLPVLPASHISYQHKNPQKNIILTGTVSSYPIQDNNGKYSFEMQAQKIQKKNEVSQAVNGKVMVFFSGHQKVNYLDQISIGGNIESPSVFSENFSYPRFLESKNIFSVFYGKFLVDSTQPTQPHTIIENLKKNLFYVREQFENRIRQQIPFPESEYSLGIILGAEKSIPQETIEAFNRTGLRHLLALSGFNITILIIFIFAIFSFLPPFLRVVLSILLISLFVVLTGASDSVVRAAIMGSLGIMIIQRGNSASVGNLIILSVFIISLFNPFLLFSSPALQLSVLAVLGMFFFIPILKRYIPQKNIPNVLYETFLATISAQIFTLPYVLFMFESFSSISVIANLVIAPITSICMGFSFLVSVPFFGDIFVLPAYFLLSASLSMVSLFDTIPLSHFSFPFPFWAMVISYSVLIIFLIYDTRQNSSLKH